MAFISQRPSGSTWNEKARYIEESTSALQRYVTMGDEYARQTKMKEYTPTQAQEADISLYQRLIGDEQKTGPGRMPERGSNAEAVTTSKTTGWGKKDIAVSGVSHQPEIQAYHHASSRLMLQEHDGHLHHQRLQAIERQRNIKDHYDMIDARKKEEARLRRQAKAAQALEELRAAKAAGKMPMTRAQKLLKQKKEKEAADKAKANNEKTPEKKPITKKIPVFEKNKSSSKKGKNKNGKDMTKGIKRKLNMLTI